MGFKKIKTRNLNFLLFGIIMIIMSNVLVSAFGVGFVGSKLDLSPGEVYDTAFSLQNTNEGNLVVEASIESGAEYMSFTGGTRFEVPEGSNIAVPVKISVPETAGIGDEYSIKVLFKPVSGDLGQKGNGTTIGFAIGQSTTIGIEVIQKPAEETPQGISLTWWILGIVVIVIVILIIWFILKNKNK